MASETTKAKSRLAALASSFDDLEELLEPLFSQSLPETLMTLEPIQQAKLQTLLPYLVYDLIFVYLKTRGIDPKGHPVISELDRVKQYFEKVAKAEKPEDKPATKLDKDAAGRFIKHAITQISRQMTGDEVASSTPVAPAPSVPIPVKMTSKMVARAEYERQLEAQSSDEEGLEIISESADENSMDIDVESGSVDKHKAKFKSDQNRKRPVVDPFAGYGDDSPMQGPDLIKAKTNAGSTTPASIDEGTSDQRYPASTSQSSKRSKKQKKIQRE